MYRPIILMLTILLPVNAALAAKPVAGDEIPPDALYRYINDKGRLVISSTLPQEAIYSGYDIIDQHGRLLKTVEKALPEAERKRQKEALAQKDRDRKLLKLYPTAEDALRARDRKIAAIKLNIDYANNTIGQLNTKLSAEVSSAAKFEKSGRPIPDNMQAAIDQFSRQIREQEKKIDQLENDVKDVNAEFDPIIARLKKIASEKSD